VNKYKLGAEIHFLHFHLLFQIEPAEGVMAIDYLGQTFKGDLLPSGKIKSQETGVNFINILQAAFTQADPKSVKKILTT